MNRVTLIGFLGSDPELRYTQAGKAVANFRLATNERVGDQDKTEWHNIVAWEGTAKACNEHIRKGSQVAVEGRIASRKYQDRDGQDRWINEIVATRVEFLDRKPADEDRGRREDRPAQGEPQDRRPGTDDDIPF